MVINKGIADRFKHHDLDEAQANVVNQLRDYMIEMGKYLEEVLNDSREKSLAITKLEESLMWANKAIALNGPLKED